MTLSDLRMNIVLQRVIRNFERINESEKLTDADRQQLKNSYLQNYFEPEARELLKAKLAEQKAREERRKNWRRKPTEPTS